jgi:DNA-binding CsgD family transcriptional regulator
MELDPIAAIETLYRTDVVGQEWLVAVAHAVRPLLDPGDIGVHGGFYHSSREQPFVPEEPLMLGFTPRTRAVFDEGMAGLNEDFIVGSFLASGITRGAAVAGWRQIPTVRDGAFASAGLIDVLNMAVVEPDGSGCALASFRREAAVLRGPESHLLRALFRHFAAAHRLQRGLRGGRQAAPDRAAAVLASNGRVLHARGAATDPIHQLALRAAVARSEDSRGRRRRRDPHGALDAWASLVAGRWTLVDYFDHDGQRYLLALDNGVASRGLAALTSRERDVVRRAVLGATNKVIAYDLGISHSTVRVLVARAARKLGVRTRQELVDLLASQDLD